MRIFCSEDEIRAFFPDGGEREKKGLKRKGLDRKWCEKLKNTATHIPSRPSNFKILSKNFFLSKNGKLPFRLPPSPMAEIDIARMKGGGDGKL